jgi:hypothetical protein
MTIPDRRNTGSPGDRHGRMGDSPHGSSRWPGMFGRRVEDVDARFGSMIG